MPHGILQLPTELILMVVANLAPEDFFNFGLTCKRYSELLCDARVCRDVLQHYAPFSKDFPSLASTSEQHATVFRAMLKRRNAVAQATPFTAAIVARASSFILMNGFLVYNSDANIRVLNTKNPQGTEFVINHHKILPALAQRNHKLDVLHYSHGFLSCLVEMKNKRRNEHMLMVIDTERRRLVSCDPILSEGHTTFVRNNGEFLAYGTKSELSACRTFRRWALYILDLRTGHWNANKRVLAAVVGSEIGRSINFSIFDGYLYAVSGRTAEEVESAFDGHSSYYALRFPLDKPTIQHVEETNAWDMYRREHSEGAIDDRWTSISLERDELTGDIMVCEQRQEWLSYQSYEPRRTFYRQKIIFPPQEAPVENPQLFGLAVDMANALAGPNTSAIFGTLLQGHDEPPVHSAQDRTTAKHTALQSRVVHNLSQDDNLSQDSKHPFHETDIFLRGYDTPSKAFVDFVKYAPVELEHQPRPLDRPQLRIRSILGGSPTTLGNNPNGKNTSIWPSTNDNNDNDSEPPDLKALLAILNPPCRSSFKLDAQIDSTNGTLVYATEAKADIYGVEGVRLLVLVSFDPRVRLGGLPKWHRRGTQPSSDFETVGTEGLEGGEDCAWAVERAAYLTIASDGEERGTPYGYDFTR